MEKATSYETAYGSGTTFAEFVESAEANRALWHAFQERTPLFEEEARQIGRVEGCWRLLVLADDWCGDAVNTVPIIARLAEASENVELRIVSRDRFPSLRDRHLTNGTRSIPIAVLLDEAGRAAGAWGPRPSPLQTWFEEELRALPKEERYRELRRWYARDRGATTAREIADLVEGGAEIAAPPSGRPCGEHQAA